MHLLPHLRTYEYEIKTIDSHTEGESTRIVYDGFPRLRGATMMEKKRDLLAHYDFLRRALMLEPRGHRDMFGAVLTEPVHPEADTGVIYINSGGTQYMCGHGSIGTASMLVETGMVEVKEPYTDPWSQEHQYRGQLRLDMETLTAVFKRSHELGFTVHVHAIGDGALAMTLDAIERTLAETGPHDYRDAVTHLQVVDKADIPRMAKLGVVAVTDPHWFDKTPEFDPMIVANIGEERAANQLPMRSFFDTGVVVTSASDYPVINPAYPLVGMQKGVIRQLPGRLETLHNPGERVTIEQMIEATTINEAYQLLCDDRLGSITVGKEADLVVLGTDITACSPEHIQDAPVFGTMVGGEWVYTCK